MMKKILLTLFILTAILSTALAAPSISSTSPTLNETWIGTHTYSINFTVITEDTNGKAAVNSPKLEIYYSPSPGAYKTLIVSDTNLVNASGVLCSDYNFLIARDCNYSWTVPGFETLPIGAYYIDLNLGAWDYSGAGNSYAYYQDSSSRFNVNQGMPTSTATMIALALFIAAAGLAVFFVFKMAKGETTVDTALSMAIAVIVLLIVGWTLYGIAVVPV